MDAEKVRRVYGRGFADGRKEAAHQMNNARVQSIERGLSSIARKVLEATPVSEWWSVSVIATEVHRQHGSGPDPRVVNGCLRALVESGLVREGEANHFQRTYPRPALVPKPQKEAHVAKPTAAAKDPDPPTAEQPESPIDMIAKIAASMRNLAQQLDDAALSIEERLGRESEDSAKLRQLRQLLGGGL